jgi:hypothetical protein
LRRTRDPFDVIGLAVSALRKEDRAFLASEHEWSPPKATRPAADSDIANRHRLLDRMHRSHADSAAALNMLRALGKEKAIEAVETYAATRLSSTSYYDLIPYVFEPAEDAGVPFPVIDKKSSYGLSRDGWRSSLLTGEWPDLRSNLVVAVHLPYTSSISGSLDDYPLPAHLANWARHHGQLREKIRPADDLFAAVDRFCEGGPWHAGSSFRNVVLRERSRAALSVAEMYPLEWQCVMFSSLSGERWAAVKETRRFANIAWSEDSQSYRVTINPKRVSLVPDQVFPAGVIDLRTY